MAQPIYFVQPERSVWYPSGPRTFNTHKRFDEVENYPLDFELFLGGSLILSATKEDSGVTIASVSNTATTITLNAVAGTGHTIVRLITNDTRVLEVRLNFLSLDTFRRDYNRSVST